ncbi:tRNA (adenosine(37)-N6)-threonylcarbamoyltransferase complex ATPase subunit type 1 TsaE [Paenibacillus sp. GCM10012307]|uniref:tRNA threonylcarbamoyladenosine biosynthesis protein TsaE n=1 Tax=Paenibacillus roseus TaxID=2798579 RepID=A0A934J4K3_9BACL|nr:tRNA (adenosine(37)-N6)-threonylcarbamoyltransferase complex ATPase subunit type 1 TsaE [Paenibacillus roseus]MBJ6360223.1 tRNA (adenosine(37)-N6)-threonylcarbamoyltransferase complex ATPase subunit type 1 TsaE [Paenibacillus roseus]
MSKLEVTQSEWTVHSEQDTVWLANWLGDRAVPGIVLALDGDLGAGKTRFSQAFAASVGVTAVVNSPTFTIIKEYTGSRLPFYHMDVYRISLEEAEDLGLDDYFFGEGATIVEWASIIEPILPESRLDLYIEHLGGEARRFMLAGRGEPYATWCRELGMLGGGSK